MITDLTFDKEFDRFYRSIPEDILKLNGISKELMDVGEMSHNYFTNNWNEGGKIDHNANSNKTCVVNYASEVVKPLMKLEGVYLLHRYLRKSMSSEKADRIIMSVLSGDMYVHDFSGIGIQQPYCIAFSTHWILENGTPFGQLPSTPPMHTRSFIGQVAEMVMSMSQQFAGATAPADVLVAYAHLAKKEGVTAKEIENDLQSLVHILNKEFRGGSQSAYSNISIFDRPGLEHLFGDMLYSDGTTIDIDYVMFVQEVFMEWFSRGVPTTGEPYRFPVVTVNISTDDDGNILDDDFVKLVSKYNLSTGCFNIHSGESSKIASCCRLTSSLEDMRKYNQDSFGNGGLNIGSTHVVTINLPRIAVRTNNVLSESVCEVNDEDRKRTITSILERLMDDAASILDTHRNRILSKRIEQGFFPLIDVGLVDVDTMFSTFGFTGVPEFVEILGYDITSEEGIAIAGFVMDKMDELSLKISDEYGYAFNVEEVPAESASVTLRDLDVLKYGDDYAEFIGKEMYSNQFIPLTYDVPIIDRVTITGQLMAKATGGAIMHLNLDERITNESTMENLIRWTISKGVQHFAINYGFSRCINGHSTPGIVDKCSDCSGEIEDYLTRIVGYFVPVKSWNKRRQLHDFPNRVGYNVED
jgi:ribonucleoside-triphosphate reductase